MRTKWMPILIISVLNLLFITCAGQNDQYFKQLKIHTVQNIDWKKDNSASLEPFKEILESHNILTLAESSHMDGTVYDVQCSLMKELINAGIVNTIYTESSWLNTNRIKDILKSHGKSGIEKAAYYFGSAELSYWRSIGFWDFLANKIIDGKVELVGIDIETTSDTVISEMLTHAFGLKSIQKFRNEFPEKSKVLITDFLEIRQWYQSVEYSQSLFQGQTDFVKSVLAEYQSSGDLERKKQWEIILKYLYWRQQRNKAVATNSFSSVLKDDVKLTKFYSVRDSMMAEILLSHYYDKKNVKAILITTAYHAQRKSADETLKIRIDTNANFLGDILSRKLKNQVYNLCFVTSSGTRGSSYMWHNEIYSIEKPPRGSFEYFFRKTKVDYFFAELRNSPLMGKSFNMKVLFESYIKTQWSQLFDGVFFIKKMYPVRFTK